MYNFVQLTGLGGFLFRRPKWAFIAQKPAQTKAALHPAE
jgi:hypothetical protein